MQWNNHFNLKDKHAFLGASKYHWVNYDEQKLTTAYLSHQAAQKGTEIHEIAASLIKNDIKLPDNDETLNLYVNDAIEFGMDTERVLKYSDNCFGTADAIRFYFDKMFLRIHDLKTGKSATSIIQVEIYAALFCLEYDFSPYDLDMELRIYQLGQIFTYIPQPEEIRRIMDKIIIFDKHIENLKQGE